MLKKKKRKYKSIALIPHNDDESLFLAYTIMREKPLVIICTDSFIQWERGDGITNEERTNESIEAMKLAGADIEFLHIPDNEPLRLNLLEKLEDLRIKYNPDIVYAPAQEEGGNMWHNAVGRISKWAMFKKVKQYMTYGSANYTKTKGSELVIPTEEEKALKKKMLACYPSQMKISCRNFFNNPNATDYESFQ